MSAKLRQPVKRHGGKNYLAPKIIEMIPSHIHYVEPYFGGGAVLLQKPSSLIEGHSEVVNDLDGELMNLWSVLQHAEDFAKFQRTISATPFAVPEFRRAAMINSSDSVERAVAFFVRCRQSRQGLGRDFATLSRNRTRSKMNEQVSAWLSAVEGLPEVHDRLKRVVILSNEATRVIQQQDGAHTFFYLDPPYLHDTRNSVGEYGAHEMSVEQHEALLEPLARVTGKFILSGYRSELYDDFANCHGWHRRDIEIDNKASARRSKPRVTECLWFNFERE
jgi:DNA adenine methylase